MILVIANYRTGSTNVCKMLAEKYSYTDEGEAFHYLYPGTQIRSEFNRMINCNDCNDVVIKIMPPHFDASERYVPNFFRAVTVKAEEIYYTVSLDFDRQCKSWCICDVTGRFHSAEDSDAPMLDIVTPERYDPICLELLENWRAIDKYYESDPGTVIIMQHLKGEAYKFGQKDLNDTVWPENKYIDQFNQLHLIRKCNETIPELPSDHT